MIHRSPDKDKVRELARALRQDWAVDVWLDEWEILAGENVVAKMEEGLASADGILVFVSRLGLGDAHAYEEYTKGIADVIAGKKGFLIPVLDGVGVDSLPGFLGQYRALIHDDVGTIAQDIHAHMGVDFGDKPKLGDRCLAAAKKRKAGTGVPEYVFVAHARGDTLRVARLCRGLLRRGVRPWFDLWDLLPGGDRKLQLQDALRRAPAVLLVDGPAGAAASNSEYGRVLEERARDSGVVVAGVALPGVSAPAGYGALEDESWEQALDRLGERLGRDHERRSWLGLERQVFGDDMSPYLGLRAFEERDARWMFGRDEEVDELLRRIEAGSEARFLMVSGASGSGKSSLVLGGLCPALRSGVLEGARVWRIATLRPGRRPCEALAMAVQRLRKECGVGSDQSRDGEALAGLRDRLMRDCETLRLELSQLLELRAGEAEQPAMLLLVVDQFEELFAQAGLGREEEGGGSSDAEAFVGNLIAASEEPGLPCWVVSTLRADFLPSCVNVSALAGLLNGGSIYSALPAMSEAQIRDVVELPALRAGFEVQVRLVDKLVDGVVGRSERLPLLEHVLRELWRRRDEASRELCHASYADAGGLEGAVAKTAEDALAKLCRPEHLGERGLALTQRLMTRLVNIGKETLRDTRRRVSLDELGSDDETRQVLGVFVGENARVLVGDEVDGVEVVELAHDALLREWGTLVEWVNSDRKALRLRAEIARDAAKYLGKDVGCEGEDERAGGREEAQYLWSRGRVEEARRVLEGSSVALSEREERFVAASEEVAQRRRRRGLGASVGVFVALLIVLLFIVELNAENEARAEENGRLARKNAKRADQNAELAERERQAVAGQKGLRAALSVAHSGYTVDAALLAIEAAGVYGPDFSDPSPAVYDGMFRVEAADPAVEYATFGGHTETVKVVALSPEGERLATGGGRAVRLWAVDTRKALATFEGHTKAVNALAFSPDGKCLASAGEDGTSRLWEVETKQALAILEGHRGSVNALAFSPDGRRLATAGEDHTLRLWEVATGKALVSFEGHTGSVEVLAFSPDGRHIATGSEDNGARLWGVETGKALMSFEGHTGSVVALAFSPDGRHLATGSWDHGARLWELGTGKALTIFEGHTGSVVALAFSPDGRCLATGSWDYTARLWEVETGEALMRLEGHTGLVSALAFSPEGRRLVTGSWDGMARLWEVETGEGLAILEGHTGNVDALALSPDGRRLVTGSWDGTARLWELGTGKGLTILEGHTGSVVALAFSPDGERLATGSWDRTARLWDVETGKGLATLEGHTVSVDALAFSPEGRRLATGSWDQTVRLWAAETGEALAILEGHTGFVGALAFSPEGRRLATGSWDQTVRLWDVETGKTLVILEGHSNTVDALAFSPDGRRLATGSWDGTARLWEPRTGKGLATLEGHGNAVNALVFSPEGGRLATASRDQTARIWGVEAGKAEATLEGHINTVNVLAFSPDGRYLATGSDDGTARLWEVETGEVLDTLEGHMGGVRGLAFSPEGRRLATGSEDHTARLWDVETGEALATLEGHSGSVNALAFSPSGERLATASADGTINIWPMPELGIRLLCKQVEHATRYAEVAEICDPLLSQK
ncbi:TIR domain-containing protein [Pseudenhygromyxa sp. WMMC2535]|uniref:nSTAND1 domain-containing NTPase n=1 Tax=Pseudenhygromyxa sp. WMMC2535 TaxID=2712867 RepID=UPI00155434F1|nr:TIR domain-containing protein [Pseudenhygromyxa sp. WMMC2535]NVB37599.1 TIR domain-containing protein [Pseudenhygromyxa sp. WMMC2535]